MAMVDNSNPLLDDDDDEAEALARIASKESQGKPAVAPLPDLSHVFDGLGDGTYAPSSPTPATAPSVPSPADPFTSDLDSILDDVESLGEGSQDEYRRDVTPSEQWTATDDLPSGLTSIDDLLGDIDLEMESTYEPESARSTLDDYVSPRSLEDDMDFEGVKIDLDAVLAKAIDVGASDVHISPYDEISFTVLGEIHRISEFGEIDSNMTTRLQQTIISNVLEQTFVEELELDTSYVVKSGRYKGRRTRLSVGKSGGDVFLVFRIIVDKMPTPDELDIPQSMRSWVSLPNGLILVNGPTGSGKSTTLSSLMQEIQFTRREKVITIEKPIEFVYGVKPGQKALITQREVGRDARSFANALTSAMRQAPNIILVGEVRNRMEIDELLRAAETGHLAISTMHTTSCPSTINRIRSMYEGDEQLRVLATLADNLRGMMTQTLVKSPDGKSRFAVREVLQVDPEVKEMILQGDVLGLTNYMKHHGTTMAHELVKAVKAGKADYHSARAKAPEPLYFDELALAAGIVRKPQ